MKMNMPWVESPFFEKIIIEKNLSKDFEKICRDFHQNGFVVLKNVFNDAEIDLVKKEMDEKGFNPDFKFPNQRDSKRCQDLWQFSEPVRALSINKNILDTLAGLYGREPIPFQTLNFNKGSEQMAHSDTIHFSSLPAKFMAGVWVALEDINENNGPLFYYPGSHRLPEYNFNDFRDDLLDNSYQNYNQYEQFMSKLMDASAFKKLTFEAKKGDALIWSSNIVHGGSPVLDPNSTRYSQVTHYFFKDCLYYYPMGSNTQTGELAIRMNLKNIITGRLEKMSYNGYKHKMTRTYRHLYSLNQHIYYPRFFRFLTDIYYKTKNLGALGFIHEIWEKRVMRK